MDNPQDIKSQAQQRFGQYAQGYVTSATHAKGADLDRLVTLAAPQPDWTVLDVATGGGHTALKFAPAVGRVVASDLTPRMLEAARAFIGQQGAANVRFAAADAEHLPFDSGSFNLVTCRVAAHHFPDCFRFVQECARVLQPGGMLLVQDQVTPDDEQDARYVDAFERLRDPSHVKAFAEYEWRGMFLDAGLTVDHTEQFAQQHNLLDWAQRQGNTPEIIARLQVLLKQAPAGAAKHLNAVCVGTDDAAFDIHHIIIAGHKA